MSYTNAIFYLDYVNGNDAARAILTPVTVANPSGTITRCTYAGHGLVTGAVVTLAAFSAWLNGDWKITVVDVDNFDLDGAVWQATVDASGTATPFGGMSWADAWKTIISGATSARIAPGDIVRIAKSPDTTSLGVNGTWTNAPSAIPSAVNISSSTNDSPIQIVTAINHGLVTGNLCYIQNHATNLTANGSWIITKVNDTTFTLDGSAGVGVGGATGTVTPINHQAVKLASAVTKTITRCETVWTAGANCTVTLDTSDYKEGDASVKIVTGNLGAGQLLAYLDIATLDVSSYQQVSFWIKNSTTALAAGDIQIKLCSDNLGAVPVDTLSVRAITSTGQWVPELIDKAGALGNAIESIAIYSTIAMNAKTFYFDNFIAVKDDASADSLSLQSLISKNSLATGGTEGFYGIQSISEDGKVIRLDNHVNNLANVLTRGTGYSGTTETVTTYKRETIKTAMVSTASVIVQSIQKTGSLEGGNIQFQGGYNTSTSLQDGETYFDGLNGFGYSIFTDRSYLTINKINNNRYYGGYYLSGVAYCTLTIHNLSNNIGYGLVLSGGTTYFNNISINNVLNGYSHGVGINGGGLNTITIYNANNHLNSGSGVIIFASNNTITATNVCNNVSSAGGVLFPGGGNGGSRNKVTITNASNNIYGVGFAYGVTGNIVTATTTGNTTGGIYNLGTDNNYLLNSVINEATQFSGAYNSCDCWLYSINHQNTVNNHYMYTDGGYIISDSAVRHTASGLAWRWYVTNVFRDVNYPLNKKIALVNCAANVAVTVKAWVIKSHATDIAAKLVCRGGQIAGVPSDVVVTKANDTNWEELSITFTPTAAGVVEIEGWAYWLANTADEYVVFDDMTLPTNPTAMATMDVSYLGQPLVVNVPVASSGGGFLLDGGLIR